jgi:ubiquinone/menaquinone biosynthesis C-methylase UbiE
MKEEDTPPGFSAPTASPTTAEEASRWQEMNRSWWQQHPMRYDWKETIPAEEFSREFYQEIDKRFFADAFTYMPWKKRPFEALIPYAKLGDRDVLEIGVGNGSHAQLLAGAARNFTGVDLTSYAVQSTTKRLERFGLKGTIIQADAEHLPFGADTFDFVWSWGVIHHSSDTRRVLQEIHRVLKPGGTAVLMVYYYSWWNAYFTCGLLHGIFQGELFKGKSIHDIMQKWSDGALARFYTVPEWRKLVEPLFAVKDVRIFGTKAEALPLPAGKVKTKTLNMIPDQVTRLLLNRCRMGSYLVTTLQKP